MVRVIFCLLLLIPIFAHAEPVTTVIAAISATTIAQIVITIGLTVYGSAQQRRAEQEARDAYNNSLKDRQITAVREDSPCRYVYGRARVGSDIVAIFTSGDKDQYKHLVCVHAAHECDAIEEVYIAGKALGTLDANGKPTSGDYVISSTEHYSETKYGAAFTLSYTPVDAAHLTIQQGAKDSRTTITPVSVVGNTVTLSQDYGSVTCSYQYTKTTPRVVVQKHLGVAGDAADPYLRNLLPDKWPATATLSGLCYTVVTLDLNQAEFQGGIPSIEVLLRGKKLYDPRTGTTAWSRNPALVIRDFLTGEMCNVPASDIPLASLITAANVCDEQVQIIPPLPRLDVRYAIDGVVLSTEDPAKVLERMAQAMAGGIVATNWNIWAGKYVAPVMAFDQADIVGQIAINPGLSDSVVYNGVKGQFAGPTNIWISNDFPPYQNVTYVASDAGEEKWTNIDFPLTSEEQRIWNLCRIFLEDQRNGYTVKAEFSLKAWAAQVGDRVTLTSSTFGWSNKIFRVLDKQYSPTSAVELTLKEDAASIWDTADAVTVDSTPNTTLPNPFVVSPLSALTCSSGTDVLLMMADGTIVSRIHASWPVSSNAYVAANGAIEIEWMELGGTVWNKTQVSGESTDAYLTSVTDGYTYTVRARAVNTALNVKSDWAYSTHTVIGKTAPPPDIAKFSITNGVLSWGEVLALDLAGYLIRFQYGSNASWGDAAPLHTGVLKSSPWIPDLVPPGQITLMIKAVDTSGNVSVNSANIEVNLGDTIVDNVILTYDDKAVGFSGTKTNCSVVGGNLVADDSGDLFWGGDNSLPWGTDTANFWPTATYKAMTYMLSYMVDSVRAGSRMTLAQNITAQSYTLQFRYDTQGSFWGGDSDYFWGVDSAAFWPAPTDWQTWPGAIESAPVGRIDFRIVTQAGTTQGAVSTLQVQFDVPDESENLSAISISASGTRLPITKAYRAISNVQLTLQADGGAAVTAKYSDKSISGPLIYCYNSSGVAVSGTIDATVQGVKG